MLGTPYDLSDRQTFCPSAKMESQSESVIEYINGCMDGDDDSSCSCPLGAD